MKRGLLINLGLHDLLAQRAHFAFALFGLAMGTATLVFFFALVKGVQTKVINELFPVNLVEFVPISSGMPFGKGASISPDFVKKIKKLPGVRAVFPKKKAQFQAVLWGKLPLVTYKLHLEAFFDGITPKPVQRDIRPKPKKGMPFAFLGQVTPCHTDKNCQVNERCLSGYCVSPCNPSCKGKCIENQCLPACKSTSDCLPGRVCYKNACQPLACRVSNPNTALSDDINATRGQVTGLLFVPGARKHGVCPKNTYCATFSLTTRNGACEAPIPVVLSPLLTELYNSVASSAFHLPTMKDLSVLTGLRFSILYGESYFVGDKNRSQQVVKQAVITGFSPEAIDLGVTMPMGYVNAANSRFRGKEASKQITSMLVQTKTNEAVPGMVRAVSRYGMVPAPKYQASKRMADVLYILALIFAAVALIVLIVSAGGIAHVLLMLVNEKAVELALFRSLGASRGTIRWFILFEGFVIGLAGGLAGLVLARVLAWVTDWILLGHMSFLPIAPTSLFVFHWWICLLGIVAAIISALIGGIGPAEHACHIDPARTLSQE